MDRGDVIADRFEIERVAGSGGMGTVWRARDRRDGGAVAVKVMREHDADQVRRFVREAELLAELRHPGIVRYVAHGKSTQEMWLAMEWLEGESLAERLKRQGLTLDETLTFARRCAGALAAAHDGGVIHRDLKPSNLYLVRGSVSEVRLLDFGIARLREGRRQLTITGSMLGTPGYMAPEQARGEPTVDARADVFAFGCVLFKCLTGRAVFSGEDGLAVLLRVVLEEAPRVSDLRDDVPPALDDLVARMLTKDPAGRPGDGAALLAELDSLGEQRGRRARRQSTGPPGLTATERRVTCLMVARVGRPEAAVDLGIDGPTMVDASPLSDEEDDRPTLAMDAEEVSDAVPAFADWASRERALAGVAERYGGKLHWLADGSLLVTVDTSGAATDQAARAALCALEMRPLLAAIPVALVAGRAVVSRRMPMGEVIDRAVAMLAEHDAVLEATGERPAAGVARVDAIRLDEVVAGLLDPRFDVGGDRAGLFLRGKRDVAEARRTLLGRPSPCVGREREIASLLSVYDACFATGAARAVVITAAPGVGKSRLRFELMARLAQRGAQQRAAAGAGSMAFGSGVPEVWFARCDPMSAGSPFGMVVRMVQRAAGLLDAESPEVRQQKLRARVARHLPATERRRVTEFLGELCGVQFDDRDSVQLRAARRDAVLMGDQMRRAWEDFLRAEVAARPLLIILEDLQWGDLPTVQLIDAALRNLGDRPWMVLALGRPEIGDIFPDLWAGRAVTRVELDDLSRQGSEQLVRAVLGDDIDAATVARLAERAGGNAFYLEELIRAVVEGRGEMLPETVLAMVQARLETLPGAARLLLRAASVFGQIFWPGGLCTLVGEEADPATVAGALAELCEREVVVRRGEGRFPGEDEHIFRHALLREAAYSMLTDADRMLGHRLAGEWLERAGERDAALLAEHFERGDEPARATHWFRRAAEQALEGNDFDAACARADRGVALGASGALLGELRLVQAEAHGWRGQNAEAESCARVAMSTLPRGERAWFAAAGQAALASGRLGKPERLGEVAQMLSERGTAARPGGPEVVAAAHTVGQLLYAGRPDRAGPLLARLDAYERVPTGPVPSDPGDDLGSGVEGDPRVRGWVHSARATQALFIGDPGAYLKRRLSSANAFERAGDLRNACIQQVSVGYAYLELGAHLDAEAALRDALGAGERMGLSHACALARHNLGMALALLGRLQEARTLETEAATAFEAQGNRRLEGHARIYLAMILLMLHELDTADEEARLAVVVSAASPPGRAQALATLAQVKLARRSVGEALEAARDGLELLERLGGLDEGEALVRLSHAEALAAAGQSDPARRAIAVAHRRLMERAARISDAEWRRSFLERVPENARTIQLARTWRVD